MNSPDEATPEDATPDTAESTNADATPPPSPPPQPPPPPADGPWAADLAEVFTDPETRAAVDGFLREKVQPHVTKLEQESAPDRAAQRLYSDFTERPVDTYYDVTREIFGDEAADAVRDALASDEDAPDPDAPVTEAAEADLSALAPEHREAIEWAAEQRREQAFNAELDRVKEANPDLDIKNDLFFPFVTAAEGDLDAAVGSYKQFIDQAKEQFGGEKGPDPAADAPSTVGTTDATTPPPTEKKFGSLDEAMDAYFDEQKSPPTTVGQV